MHRSTTSVRSIGHKSYASLPQHSRPLTRKDLLVQRAHGNAFLALIDMREGKKRRRDRKKNKMNRTK
jgi:hypothetical protein